MCLVVMATFRFQRLRVSGWLDVDGGRERQRGKLERIGKGKLELGKGRDREGRISGGKCSKGLEELNARYSKAL